MLTDKRKVSESPGYRAGRAISGLRPLKETMGLVTAALAMSLQGQTRATAGEVAERASKDFETDATASEAGRVFSQMHLATATTHGKTRLVLDAEQLKSIREKVAEQCRECERELKAALDDFRDGAMTIKALQDQWKEIVRMRAMERELSEKIQQERKIPSKLPYLENEAAKLLAVAEKVDTLQKDCKEMEKKIAALPSLQEREVSLQAVISQYKEEEREVAAAEARLGLALTQLKERNAWVTFLDLEHNINKKKAELEELSKRLGEKRSLLQRMFGGTQR
jgi:hypothetical protein